MWIDTHCHLDAAEFAADRDAVREAARLAGVARCVIPAVQRAHWADVAQQLGLRARRGKAVNLDPAALLMDMVLHINETAGLLA